MNGLYKEILGVWCRRRRLTLCEFLSTLYWRLGIGGVGCVFSGTEILWTTA